MENKNKIILALAILLVISLAVAGFYYRQHIINESFTAGFQTAQAMTAQAVIKDIQEKGYTSLTIGEKKLYLAYIPPGQIQNATG